jgi:hypothetical protein
MKGVTMKYWAEEHRDGEIDVVVNGDHEEALRRGAAVQFYEGNYGTAIKRLSERFPGCEYWYTERNGDPITMVVPAGTHHDALPSVAMGYMAFEWIKHDADFGTGVRPLKVRLQAEAWKAKRASKAAG